MSLIEQALADPRALADRPPDATETRREDLHHTSFIALTVNR